MKNKNNLNVNSVEVVSIDFDPNIIEVENKSKRTIQKEKYENDLLNIEIKRNEKEQKIIITRSWFKRLWMNLMLSCFLKVSIKKVKINHFFYLRHVKRVKNKTLKMSGDVWYKRIWTNVSGYTFLFIMLIVMLFPFYWMIITSFKDYSEIDSGVKETLWPKHWTLTAYKDMFTYLDSNNQTKSIPFYRFFTNSLFIALMSTGFSLIVSVIAGFAIYNWRTKFNYVFMIIMFSIMMVPGEALILGRYWIAVKMQWKNNLLALVVPFIGNVFTIYLMSNAFYGLNRDLKRAAKIDGLSSFQYFVKIALPAVSATILTSFIISFIESWNSVLWPITIMDQDSNWRTIPMMLYALMNLTGDVNPEIFKAQDPINVKMAASIMAILPMIIVFIVFNKWIINGLTKRDVGGSSKG
ncbi:sn-glycerol-3-phosphate ABC transporter permease [Mesoplasma entomophilum]|uniref:ABC transmembrane type-1 domain-containing protein n=1 Tax=Mesoplasma entomophilum TaxID=2149 RepID=A0A3S5XZ44_9MOLU|nr:carbohydrate ABC transporter permease [Mesoplasma entomophilum]ATQ35189.1 hypothetical protein CS528_00125 [Mesoplasma entomophilum]ATZ19134.1 sn-glycerol-3-phosphate ABC transporter permease [Mesoplasma entomophilum]